VEDGGPSKKPEWQPISAVGRNFGDPPTPLLSFLQPPPLCTWQESIKAGQDVTIANVGKYRKEQCVKLLHGTNDLNVPGRPPRPRSAVILRKDLADLKVPPRATQPGVPEAIYLVHCDSTDTTLARGPDVWLPERMLEERPMGAGRDFCSDGRPRFSKKYGGMVGLTFDQILAAEIREANVLASPPAPKERRAMPRSGRTQASAWKPEHEIMWATTPKLRRRKFCPPPQRVRVSPRRERYEPQRFPQWVSSMEGPRSRIMIGDLDASPPPPPHRMPRVNFDGANPERDESEEGSMA